MGARDVAKTGRRGDPWGRPMSCSGRLLADDDDDEMEAGNLIYDCMRITSEIIAEISNKLHTKSSISAKELQILKNGLMDPKNVEIFLHVHGALRGLIRELTCSDIKKQCISAGCVCNLSLGDSGGCSIIAKAAGPYLNASLDNLTVELAVNCAWALGNLAGSDVKVCKILVTQGALNKLCKVYINEDIQNAVLYALLHFVYQLKDELRQARTLARNPANDYRTGNNYIFITDTLHIIMSREFPRTHFRSIIKQNSSQSHIFNTVTTKYQTGIRL
ncbi:unnamed protein product [Danaus chrysippus]|uniref:(African queen) hypothetical protein n=1 Tax=Danaus chrysippus TaxID=151541 RepID=A0A8J2W0D7_9NEOP|nr:unnamed protein product [Danaus chrysippus]